MNGIVRDESWRADNMRAYARRLESCQHRPLSRAMSKLGIDGTGHGWQGWLNTEMAMPMDAFGDSELVRVVVDSAAAVTRGLPQPLVSALRWLNGHGDPNAQQRAGRSFTGVCYTPLSTNQHGRAAVRERGLARLEDSVSWDGELQ